MYKFFIRKFNSKKYNYKLAGFKCFYEFNKIDYSNITSIYYYDKWNYYKLKGGRRYNPLYNLKRRRRINNCNKDKILSGGLNPIVLYNDISKFKEVQHE